MLISFLHKFDLCTFCIEMMETPVLDYGIGMIGDTIIEYNFGFVLDLSKRRNG